MTFSLPSKRSSREAEFWGWFEKNEDRLFHFEHDRERIFGRLMTAIHRVHPDLTFEFGPVEGGNREFVISADGHGAAFPAVEAVFAAAPSLPRWKFTKFRPRRPAMGLKIQGVTVNPEDLEVSVEADGNKVGLTVFMRGFDEAEEEALTYAAFIMLDHAVGEYDMETQVGFVSVKAFDEETPRARFSLQFLPIAFDDFVKR